MASNLIYALAGGVAFNYQMLYGFMEGFGSPKVGCRS